ncbi:MAG TPA: Uma2 family endonuclease, partial [Longimicrobiales bacterium]|nr:Uma2 family endonuclease [Longimicrobiales bacterium]
GLGDRAVVRVQNPVRLSDLTEPRPDITLLRPRDDFYTEGHPGPADVDLIVEVAHTTLAYDRDIKLPLYATAGVPEVWIVHVQERVVEVYDDPSEGRYQVQHRASPGQVLHPRRLPSLSVRVEDVPG